MLLRVSLENWLSYRDKINFSMLATEEKQHMERVPLLPQYKTRALPIATLYGGNASGKSNFVHALAFAKMFVLQGTLPDAPIPVDPYLLDTAYAHKPSCFEFLVYADEKLYEFSFAATTREVVEEKMTLITRDNEEVLYHRKHAAITFSNSHNEDQFLHFAFQGTRKNQLFLTNAISQNVNTFRPVYDWFKKTLEVISPTSRFENVEHYFDSAHPLNIAVNACLSQLDTGIAALEAQDIPFAALPLPETVKRDIQEKVQRGTVFRINDPILNQRVIVTNTDGTIQAKKLVAQHSMNDGSTTIFDMLQESDGTRRIIDILPIFLNISTTQQQKVFVVDEVDRSLHSLVTQNLLEMYLSHCHQNSRSQLILTTHDVLLMDKKILRLDEMWVTERTPEGCSKLYSFSEFSDARHDSHLGQSYLEGRLGGIPHILLTPPEEERL